MLIACGNRHKANDEMKDSLQLFKAAADQRATKLIESTNRWEEMEASYNVAKSLTEKDSILMEMSHEKFHLGCEQAFDSIIWSFLQDERTFYYPFKSVEYEWYVATSKDGKVRMYSYDKGGGTARYGRTIIQYIDELGHLRLRELSYEQYEKDGFFITPMYKTIKKTKLGYTLYGGTTLSSHE